MAPVRPVLHQLSYSTETSQNMSFGSNKVGEIHSLQKNQTRYYIANLYVNHTSSASFAWTLGVGRGSGRGRRKKGPSTRGRGDTGEGGGAVPIPLLLRLPRPLALAAVTHGDGTRRVARAAGSVCRHAPSAVPRRGLCPRLAPRRDGKHTPQRAGCRPTPRRWSRASQTHINPSTKY
jgi:hypothetical protein